MVKWFFKVNAQPILFSVNMLCFKAVYLTSYLLLLFVQFYIFPCLFIHVSAPDMYSTTAASERCLTLLLFMSKTRWEGGREVGLKGVKEGSYNVTFSEETWRNY